MRRRQAASLLLASLLLGGCAGLFPAEEAAPPPEPAPAPPPPTLEIAPEPVPPDAALLIGLDPAALEALLGAPALVRREAGVQLFQYRAAPCVLDIALYSPSPDQPFRARHIEARDREGEEINSRDCLALLVPKEFWLTPEPEDR